MGLLYHMELLSICIYAVTIMGLLSIESYLTCCNISYGTSVQDGIIRTFVHPQVYQLRYVTIVHKILWDLLQFLL